MLEIESQVIDKTKASKSDHEYRVNNSPDFNTYLKLAYELKSIEEMAKKKKSEMAPFETKVREDALHLMEDRKDFENFKAICEMMIQNHHHNPVHLSQIIDLAMSMNPSGKRKYNKAQLLQFVTR